MQNRHFWLLLFSISLLFPLVSGYTDTSFTVTFQLSPDKVHVIEKTTFLLDGPEEKAAFSNSLRLGRSTVSDWKPYSRNIDYHVYAPLVFVNTTRIVAKQDFSIQYKPAVVVVEYDANPSILVKTVKSSRVTEYSVNASLLNLNTLAGGEIVLGNIEGLRFEVPEGDEFSKVQPDPTEKLRNYISFHGPLTSKFNVAFIQEKTLSEEVSGFFFDTFSNAANLIPLLLLLAFLLFLWFKLVSDA